jgi:hypothetical protein
MQEQLEHILLESQNKPIYLSTRITQKESKMLDEIRGWLQTERSLSTVSKQETVMHTIRVAYEYMQTQIAHMDGKLQHIVHTIPEEMESISNTEPTQNESKNFIEAHRVRANSQNVHIKKTQKELMAEQVLSDQYPSNKAVSKW